MNTSPSDWVIERPLSRLRDAGPHPWSGCTASAYALQDAGLDTQLRRFGVTVVARVPTAVHLSEANARYLATKARKGAHTLDIPLSAG